LPQTTKILAFFTSFFGGLCLSSGQKNMLLPGFFAKPAIEYPPRSPALDRRFRREPEW
jgi:hypothetical protein